MTESACQLSQDRTQYRLRGCWRISELHGKVMSPIYKTVEGFPSVQLSIDFSGRVFKIATTIIPAQTISMDCRWRVVHKDAGKSREARKRFTFWNSPTLDVNIPCQMWQIKADNGFMENGCLRIDFCYMFTAKRMDSPAVNPRQELGRVGIANQQNTCYMNAVMQILFSIPGFVRVVYRHNCPEDSAIGAMQDLFAWMQLSSRPASTVDLTTAFQWSPECGGVPQDANEFYVLLIDRLMDATGDPLLERMFRFEEVTIRRCLNVDGSKETRGHNTMVLVYATDGLSVQEAIQARASGSVGQGECCADEQGLQTYELFARLPEILVVTLQRFTYNGNERVVSKSIIPYDEELDISSDVMENVGNSRYRLLGVIAHTGTPERGHYVAIVRGQVADKWIFCNDSNLSDMTKNQAFDMTMKGDWTWYMLFYVRESSEDIMSPLKESDIPEHVLQRYKERERYVTNREAEENKVLFRILVEKKDDDNCPLHQMFLWTAHEMSFQRTDKLGKLRTDCAQLVGTSPDKILLWRCEDDKPRTYIDAPDDAEIPDDGVRPTLFVQTLDSPLDACGLQSMVLVFVRFYTQRAGTPIKYLGHRVLFDTTQTVSSLANEFPELAEKQLICVKELDMESPKHLPKVELSDPLFRVADNRQILYLVFQETPLQILRLYQESEIRDSSEIFPAEALNTYENFLEQRCMKVVLRIVPKDAPNSQPVALRTLWNGPQALSKLKRMIATLMKVEYNPEHNAMILEYNDPMSGRLIEFKLSQRTRNDTLVYYRIENSCTEQQLESDQARVYCFTDYCKMTRDMHMPVSPHMTVEHLIKNLRDRKIVSEQDTCRVYEVLSPTRLSQCDMNSPVRKNSVFKVDIIPEQGKFDSDDVRLCQVNQLQHYSDGFEFGASIPFFFPLRRSESFPDMVRQLEGVLDPRMIAGNERQALLSYECRSSSSSHTLTEDSIPFTDISENCHLCVVLHHPGGKPIHDHQSSLPSPPPQLRPLCRTATDPLRLGGFK